MIFSCSGERELIANLWQKITFWCFFFFFNKKLWNGFKSLISPCTHKKGHNGDSNISSPIAFVCRGLEGGIKFSKMTHMSFQIFFHTHPEAKFLKKKLQFHAVLLCPRSLMVIIHKFFVVYNKNSPSWFWIHCVALENASLTVETLRPTIINLDFNNKIIN